MPKWNSENKHLQGQSGKHHGPSGYYSGLKGDGNLPLIWETHSEIMSVLNCLFPQPQVHMETQSPVFFYLFVTCVEWDRLEFNFTLLSCATVMV